MNVTSLAHVIDQNWESIKKLIDFQQRASAFFAALKYKEQSELTAEEIKTIQAFYDEYCSIFKLPEWF